VRSTDVHEALSSHQEIKRASGRASALSLYVSVVVPLTNSGGRQWATEASRLSRHSRRTGVMADLTSTTDGHVLY
jgi:hypothetical protein